MVMRLAKYFVCILTPFAALYTVLILVGDYSLEECLYGMSVAIFVSMVIAITLLTLHVGDP